MISLSLCVFIIYRNGFYSRASIKDKEITSKQMKQLYSLLITQSGIQQKHPNQTRRDKNDWTQLWIAFLQIIYCFEKSFETNTFDEITTFLTILTPVFVDRNDNGGDSNSKIEVDSSKFYSLLRNSNDLTFLECIDNLLIPSMELFLQHCRSQPIPSKKNDEKEATAIGFFPLDSIILSLFVFVIGLFCYLLTRFVLFPLLD
jgi:hypothetical protein